MAFKTYTTSSIGTITWINFTSITAICNTSLIPVTRVAILLSSRGYRDSGSLLQQDSKTYPMQVQDRERKHTFSTSATLVLIMCLGTKEEWKKRRKFHLRVARYIYQMQKWEIFQIYQTIQWARLHTSLFTKGAGLSKKCQNWPETKGQTGWI